MRDAKLMQIDEGANQIQRVVIARELPKESLPAGRLQLTGERKLPSPRRKASSTPRRSI